MTAVLETSWGAALVAFVAMAFAVLALAMFWEGWSDRRRQKEIRRRIEKEDVLAHGVETLFRNPKRRSPGWVRPLSAQVPQLEDLQRLLDQTSLSWHVGTFLILTVGAALTFGMAGKLFTGYTLVGIAAAMLAATFPYLYVRRKRTQRENAFLEAFADGIDLLGRTLRAGHAFSTGLQMVSEEADEPVASEFREVFEEQKFGLPLDEALYGLTDRMNIPDVHIFVTAVLIQREVGGNLAEILDTLAETIRERFMIRRQVRVYTAQGRLTGYLLAALPFAMAFLITLLNRDYLVILFETPIGKLLLATALILQVIGFLVIRRIVHIEV